MNEDPRILVSFCLEKHSIANRANMLANMLVQILAIMLERFAGAYMYVKFAYCVQGFSATICITHFPEFVAF